MDASTLSPELEKTLRNAFRYFNKFMLLLFRLELFRKALVASGFASYAAGIDPLKPDDASLNALTEKYRLVRIRRQEARAGPGGPGDLAWVWPLATMILLPLALRKRKSGSKK